MLQHLSMSHIVEELESVAAQARANVVATKSALTPDLRALRHECIQLRQQISLNEELQIQRKRAANQQIQQTLTNVAAQCNLIVDAYLAKFDSLVENLKKNAPSGIEISTSPYSSRDESINQRNGYIVYSDIHQVVPFDHTRGDLDSILSVAETEVDAMLDSLTKMFIVVVSPRVDRGKTRDIENHSRSDEQNQVFEDQRKEVFEDPSLLLVKRILGEECGKVEVLHSRQQISRERKHVTINPHACHWSGEVDYDEVTYQHFFRWKVTLPLSITLAEVTPVSRFQLSSLSPVSEYEI